MSSRTLSAGAPSGRRLGRWPFVAACLVAFLLVTGEALAGTDDPKGGRILKVLPHYLDAQGRHSVNPSLFDRDAYQFELRSNPALRSGMRFDVLWKAIPRTATPLTLKLELRGSKSVDASPVVVTASAVNRGAFSRWTRVPVEGANYQALGDLLAWRVTLWRDDALVAEQRSFLWQ